MASKVESRYLDMAVLNEAVVEIETAQMVLDAALAAWDIKRVRFVSYIAGTDTSTKTSHPRTQPFAQQC